MSVMADPAVNDEEDMIVNLAEDEAANDNEKPAKPAQAKLPPVPGPRDVAPQTPQAPQPPQDGLKDLERQIESERAQRNRVNEENRRLQVERDQAIAFAQEAERRGLNVYELQNETQINAANEQLDALAGQYESALSESDFKTVAAITRKIGKVSGDLSRFEGQREMLAQQRENMKAQQQRRPPPAPAPAAAPPPPSNDPLERAIANRTPATQAFLRKHPDLIRADGSLKRSAIDAHERALDEGHAVDTAGYFNYIEGLLGGSATPAANDNEGAPVRAARAPTVAAPVARGAAPGSEGLNPNEFVMTPRMRRLAEEQGVSPREWAQNYVRLLKEGRVTPIT
jgi:hypothetical protein